LRSWYVFFFQIPLLPEVGNLVLEPLLGKWFFRRDVPSYTEEQLKSYSGSSKRIPYYRALFRTIFHRIELRIITAPTLILWSDRDRYICKEYAVPKSELVPNVKVKFFNASHWLQNDKPNEVNDAILHFLALE